MKKVDLETAKDVNHKLEKAQQLLGSLYPESLEIIFNGNYINKDLDPDIVTQVYDLIYAEVDKQVKKLEQDFDSL